MPTVDELAKAAVDAEAARARAKDLHDKAARQLQDSRTKVANLEYELKESRAAADAALSNSMLLQGELADANRAVQAAYNAHNDAFLAANPSKAALYKSVGEGSLQPLSPEEHAAETARMEAARKAGDERAARIKAEAEAKAEEDKRARRAELEDVIQQMAREGKLDTWLASKTP